jgi:hypothetical protein
VNVEDAHLEGRVCRRLRARLEALGYTDVNLWPAQGAWRTNKRLDVYRWEGSGEKGGRRHMFSSWHSMTEIVRAPSIVLDDDGGASQFLVCPGPGGVV